MVNGYLFISNSTKPTHEQLESLEPIGPSSFSKSAIWAANEIGWQLHMGVNRNHPEKIRSLEYDIKFYDQHSYRNIFALRDNWQAYKNLCKYIQNNPEIGIIHCNTPIGGVVGRLVGKKHNKKVIYTAHGFHFYKGAPFFNRTILKWIEQFLARYTDVIITINQEDFDTANTFKLKKGGKVIHIPGVGIDLNPYNKLISSNDKNIKRKELGITPEDFVIISVGDLNENKNIATIISALRYLPRNCHYLICGDGPLKQDLITLSSTIGVEEKCHFLGFRKDILELLKASNVFIMASKREGLPRSTMEAMAAGLPCIVSDIRGNRDLIEDGKGGYLVDPQDPNGFAEKIKLLISDPNLRSDMGKINLEKIKTYDIKNIRRQLKDCFIELSK